MPDYTALLTQISQTLAKPAEPWAWSWTAVASIATALAVIVALATPWIMHWLGRRPKKSNLIAEDARMNKQIGEEEKRHPEKKYYVGRMAIKNGDNGLKAVAVEAYIEEVKDDGKIRTNFLPLPLQWTHGHLSQNRSMRNIHTNQTVYLDICDFRTSSNPMSEASINITAAAGGEVSNFSTIKAEETELLIRLYQESGQVKDISLKIIWSKRSANGETEVIRNQPPVIEIISQ